MTEEQLAGAALAKMYSDGLYVATIIYKKSFDLEDENPGLTAMYKEWINGAAPLLRWSCPGLFARFVGLKFLQFGKSHLANRVREAKLPLPTK